VSGGIPAADVRFSTFQPSFLYELIFDLLLAAALVWLGHHRNIRPPGLFALYVAGYSGYRIFEETIRVDSSAYFLGLRLNFFVALVVTIAGLAWFAISQRHRHVAAKGSAAAAIAVLCVLASGCAQHQPPTAAAGRAPVARTSLPAGTTAGAPAR
jgi:prolipoprotein diacylglyceryltransferase